MIADMTGGTQVHVASRPSWRRVYVGALVLIVLSGAYLRLEGLGVRSLWRDELCTWQVSRMPLWESLGWGPELTKPPLYQFALRALTREPHPSEAWLRFPAAACGILTVLAAVWLGKLAGSWRIGLALAGLTACNGLQIYYSQEGRPYTMLLLGCAVSTALWYRLIVEPRRWHLYAYVAVTVLTLHAHYLTALTIFGQAVWWLVRCLVRPRHRPSLRPLVALVASGVLCVPIVVRYLYYRSSMFQGLNWIEPATWDTTFDVLEQLTFGGHWILLMLIPAMGLWIAGLFGLSFKQLWRPGGALIRGRNDLCGLLLAWFLASWFGLLVISWLAHPAMIARYALPAAIPAMLIPLVVAHRLDRRAPLVIMVAFMLAATPDWMTRGYAREGPSVTRDAPGLRELSRYLQEHVDPDHEAAVLTLDATIVSGWEDSERLAFVYYPMEGVPLEELRLNPDNMTAQNDVLQDPRGLWLIVLWCDPFPVLEAAGREPLPIIDEGRSYSQLLFTPYRLVRVALLEARGDVPP